MLDTLNDNSNSSIDTAAFIKARLFDMFMNDWDSFEAKWQWGEKENGNKKIYVPVPIKRDQAYSKLNGVLLNIGLNAYGLNYRQSFKNNLKNVKKFNYPAKIATLKARRSHLVEWATEYYYFLSKEAEIPGTYQNEEFDVQPLNVFSLFLMMGVCGFPASNLKYCMALMVWDLYWRHLILFMLILIMAFPKMKALSRSV